MNITTLTLTPAYGRDYRSKKQVLNDWKNEKDFLLNMPGRCILCSIKDLKILTDTFECTSLKFRYFNNTKCFIVRKDSEGFKI